MNDELEEMKPCPFCGEPAETHQAFIPWLQRFAWIVGCDGSYGSGCPGYVWKLTPMYLTEEQAVRAWNRRETMAGDQLMVQSITRPEDETMAEILLYLNMWQEAHPDLMVAMVPAEDRYQYEIIKSGRAADRDG